MPNGAKRSYEFGLFGLKLMDGTAALAAELSLQNTPSEYEPGHPRPSWGGTTTPPTT